MVTGTADLVVLGPLARLILQPNPATISADTTVSYTAYGEDDSGNPRADVTADTTFSISPDGSCAGAVCIAAKAGDHTVTGVYHGRHPVTGTATLHVTAGPLARLTLRPNPATITAGGTVTYTADGEDADGNPRGDLTAGAAFSISPDGSCTGATCTPAKAGDHTVIGTANVDSRKVMAIASLHMTAFAISPVSKKSPFPPPWLLVTIGALALLGLAAGTTTAAVGHTSHQRRWVRQHVRTELHSAPGSVTVETEDPHNAPAFTVRLQPHGDAGTQALREGE